MTILYLHQYFNTPEMAGSTRSWEFARRLAREGHRVEMITSERTEAPPGEEGRDSLWRVEEHEGVRIHWTPVAYANEQENRERMRAFLRYAWRAAGRMKELGGDLAYVSSTPLTIALPGIYGRWRLGIPMVFEVRDLWPHVPVAMGELTNPVLKTAARRLERSAYRSAEQIVALSPGMREGVIRAGADPERVHVIPNSSDLELFGVGPEPGSMFRREHPLIGDRPLMLYCGTLGRVNGVGRLVDIADRMRGLDPEIAFLIVGEGREQEQITRRARHAGLLGENLFILPSVPKNRVPALYSAADLTSSFVIDNRALWDNSANKFFDSLAAGKPILINHEGWQADLLRESGAGLVIPPDDAQAGAEAVRSFLRDPQRRQEAGKAALELARTRFDRELLFGQLHQVVLRAAGR